MTSFSIFNVQGLKPRTVPTKVPFIQDLLQYSNQLFIALTETWLREHLDAELNVDGYTLFRQDRNRPRKHRRGRDSGGVAFYLRDNMAATAEPILNFSNGVVDALGLHVKSQDLVLIVVYRQPDDSTSGHRSTSVEFRHALREIKSALSNLPSPTPEIILCGDFNLPNVTWPEGTVKTGASRDEQAMVHDLKEVTDEHFLFQQIQKPTHRRGNTLDLCFCNNPAFIHSYQCAATALSDHSIIECSTLYTSASSHSSNRQPDYRDGNGAIFDGLNFMSEDVDWDSLDKELSEVDWNSAFQDLDPGQMFDSFVQTCSHISQKHAPKRKVKTRKISKIPRPRRILMRRRTKVNRQLVATTSDAKKIKLAAEAKEIEKKLQESYRNDRSEMEHKAVSAIKKNSKFFFTYARKHSKVLTGIGPLFDQACNIITCPLKMASMLAEQYSSVFSTPKNALLEPEDIFQDLTGQPSSAERPGLNDIQFNENDIIRAIGEVPSTAAAGPDRYPAMLLKQCRTSLAKPLHMIWRKSLDTGIIPQTLKTAHVVPVHKGGTRGVPKNYRPIALTSHLIKIFEKVLRNRLVTYMERNRLFNPSQHGFRFGRSCLSQLISHYDQILELLASGENVDVVYIDFAKAFDKVDFMETLLKLKKLGITGKAGRWIHSFLTHRTQTVLVNGSRSQPMEVKSGVPQGSVLGPLLFLILIGDIDQDIAKAFLSSFADDTRIGGQITSKEDAAALQADLNTVYSWTVKNNMELNGDKFECLRYGQNTTLQSLTSYSSNSGKTILEKESVKDLGVIMSKNGNFKKHIDNAVAEAQKQCGWIMRTFSTRQVTPMLTLWKSLVQCKLDYCSQLWCPISKGNIQSVEMVQRSFLRKITGMHQLNYWEQLQYLQQYSLERRRERYRVIYVWRILERQVPNILNQEGQPKIVAKWHPRRGRECIVPPVRRSAPTYVQKLLHGSLPVHGQQLFNILPSAIRNMTECSVDCFKRTLDKYLRDVPDEPQIPGYTAQRRADSNSLLHMSRLATAHHLPMVEVLGDTHTVTLSNRGCATGIALTH